MANWVRSRAMKTCCKKSSARERGYILLVLLLFVALLSIGMMAMVERIDFQIKRDREEELIHRGAQYSRAIRRYVKKFGAYPQSIAQLDNTNQIRFLRKHYKDPITGKDFRLLHLGDVQYLNLGATTLVAADPQAQPPEADPALNQKSAAPAGANANPAPQQAESGDQSDPAQADSAEEVDSAQTDPNPPSPSSSAPDYGPLTIDSRAILGVASVSSEPTIREFNKQNRYNQWMFVYSPTTEHSGLINTPDQPPLNAGGLQNGSAPAPPSRANSGRGMVSSNPGAEQR